MTIEALSGYTAVDQSHSPQTTSQEDSFQLLGNFPQNKKEFRQYLASVPLEQRIAEQVMFNNDLAQSAWEALMFNPLVGFREKAVERRSTIILGPGFGAVEASLWKTAFYFRTRGMRVKIYPLKRIANIEPIDQLKQDYLDFLIAVKEAIGDEDLFVWAHSKWGLLNLITSVENPREFNMSVKHSFYAGAPIPNWVNSAVGQAYLFFLDRFGGDDFIFGKMVNALGNPRDVNATSFGSLNDSVLRGTFVGRHIEAGGSHSGLPNNLRVLRQTVEIVRDQQKLAALILFFKYFFL